MATDFGRERNVGTDMQSIFGPVTRWHATPGLEASTSRQALVALEGDHPARGVRWITLAAPLILVLFLAFLGARFFGATTPPPRSNATFRPATGPTVKSRVVATERQSGSGAMIVSTVSPQSTNAQPVPRKQAIASRETRLQPKRSAVITASRRSPERIEPIVFDRSCPPGSAEDRCIYRDVTEADGRLRAAYADAVRDGAPSGELAEIHRRWVRARDISLDAPDEAIRRFDRLTDELGEMREAGGR